MKSTGEDFKSLFLAGGLLILVIFLFDVLCSHLMSMQIQLLLNTGTSHHVLYHKG